MSESEHSDRRLLVELHEYLDVAVAVWALTAAVPMALFVGIVYAIILVLWVLGAWMAWAETELVMYGWPRVAWSLIWPVMSLSALCYSVYDIVYKKVNGRWP